MAIVSFTRPTDAAVARAKYNGKIVDGSEYLLFIRKTCGSRDMFVAPMLWHTRGRVFHLGTPRSSNRKDHFHARSVIGPVSEHDAHHP